MRGYLNTIFNKIFLLISRGRLLKIDNDDDLQKIQISNLANEVITDIERYQEYGFENYPIIKNSETVTLFINGNRNANKGINIRITNRKLRPKDLEKGEVRIYCIDSNETNKNYITLKQTNNTIQIITYDNKQIILDKDKIEIKDNDNNIKLDNDGINIIDKNNNKIEMKNTGIKLTDKNNNTIDMNGGFIDLNGNTKKFVTYAELNNAITNFLIALNTHTHSGVQSGNSSTGTPTPMTFNISASESQKVRTG